MNPNLQRRIQKSNEKWLNKDPSKKQPRKENAWKTGPFKIFQKPDKALRPT